MNSLIIFGICLIFHTHNFIKEIPQNICYWCIQQTALLTANTYILFKKQET